MNKKTKTPCLKPSRLFLSFFLFFSFILSSVLSLFLLFFLLLSFFVSCQEKLDTTSIRAQGCRRVPLGDTERKREREIVFVKSLGGFLNTAAAAAALHVSRLTPTPPLHLPAGKEEGKIKEPLPGMTTITEKNTESSYVTSQTHKHNYDLAFGC